MKWNIILIALLITACNTGAQKSDPAMEPNKIIKSDSSMDTNKIIKSDEEWRSVLTPSQYAVCRLKGTEPAGSGKYDKFYENGSYQCVACGNRLFDSGTKYNSGSGWPSFYDVYRKGNVTTQKDASYGMVRIEISCANCGAHLGHVFEDGPEPTGLRYCINSLALEFVPEADSLRTEPK